MLDVVRTLQEGAYQAYARDLFLPVRVRLSSRVYSDLHAYAAQWEYTPRLRGPWVTAIGLVRGKPVPIVLDPSLPSGYAIAEGEGDCRVWRVDVVAAPTQTGA